MKCDHIEFVLESKELSNSFISNVHFSVATRKCFRPWNIRRIRGLWNICGHCPGASANVNKRSNYQTNNCSFDFASFICVDVPCCCPIDS